jgi:predicted DNA-binding transcriptional regulator AlpA
MVRNAPIDRRVFSGATEIAEMLGCSRQWVNQMAREDESFPVPEVELSGGRVWSRKAIEKWGQGDGADGRGERVMACTNCAEMHFNASQLNSGRKSFTCKSSARNGPMPMAAKASLNTSRVLATSARATSARATERSDG